MSRNIFIDRRRKGNDRREIEDPCKDLEIDIYHRKRRKSKDRRQNRSLDEDYYAYMSTYHPDQSEAPPGAPNDDNGSQH